MDTDNRRALPSVDALAAHPLLAAHGAPRAIAVEAARETLSEARERLASGATAPADADLAGDALRRIDALLAPPLRPLINATGVILHTNLGRAPLADEAIAAMEAVSRGYSSLEIDLGTGRRGSRHTILEPLICRLTGAQAAMAVNNNAAAVLLALSALAAGKQVVISRGQLVEIGGGFRIPDVMRQSRAKLVECGTTNRTRAADYDAAVTAVTAAIMRVHASNFRIVGFAEQPSLDELAAVARARGLLLVDDIGSGCLLDTTRYGLAAEPMPQASIAAGADVVLFSGDKLLGGPQGGLIAGSRDAVAKMKRHPLARALRLDKASIAGLAATLRLYVEGRAEERVPVWRMIAAPLDTLAARAAALAASLGASAAETRSMVGGGSLPEESLPSCAVVLPPKRGAAALAAALRRGGVVARIDAGGVLLDLRTVFLEQDSALIDKCRAALAPR